MIPGTTFRSQPRLPAHVRAYRALPPPAAAPHDTTLPSGAPADPPLVLIVEDDAGMQIMLGMALEDAGYAIAQATNGAEALDLLKRQQPRLILLDMRMPVMDGPTFVRRLRAQNTTTTPPIVAMTAYRELDPELAALGIPWISKPMRIDTLIELIKTNI